MESHVPKSQACCLGLNLILIDDMSKFLSFKHANDSRLDNIDCKKMEG